MTEPVKTPDEGGRTPAEAQSILQGHGEEGGGGHGITTGDAPGGNVTGGPGLNADDKSGKVFQQGREEHPGLERKSEAPQKPA